MWSVWFIFCDCGFQSVCPLMKDKRLMEASWWDRLWRKMGLFLMGGAMLSTSLIQFSVDGWGCVSSLLFHLRPNYGGGNEDNGNLLQKSYACTATLCIPNPAAGHCWPMPLPETPGHSRASLGLFLVGSLLLSPGFWYPPCSVCALQESVSPVPCKFWWLYGGVNGDLLQEGLCHTQICCMQSPCPCGSPLLTHTSTGDTQTQFWLSFCGVSVSWCSPGLLEPSNHLWWVWGLILNAILPLLLSYLGFSSALGHGVSLLVWSNILLLMVVQ